MSGEVTGTLQVFGPATFIKDDGAIRLRGQSLLLVANLLAAHPNSAGIDHLCQAIWGPDSDHDGRSSLQVAVTRLRRKIGPIIEFTGGGYRLDLTATDVDAVQVALLYDQARDAQARGNTEGALDLATDALTLVVGDLLLGVTDPISIEPYLRRIDELVFSIRVFEAELLLELDRVDDALVRTRALTRAREFDEHGQGLHLEALHRSGRTAEALHHYQQYRSALVESLGLEPGQSLQQIERGIAKSGSWVAGEPTSAPVAGDREPLLESSMVGRRAELGLVADSSIAALTIFGEPGIGKSTLAQNASVELENQGLRSVIAACPQHPNRPLQVVAELLSLVSAEAAANDEQPLLKWAHSHEVAPVPFLSRDELIDSAATTIEEHCIDGTVVIVDDAHWLDSTGESIVARLIERGRVPVRIFSRANPGLSGHLREVCEQHRVIRLAAIDRGDAHELLLRQHESLLDRVDELHHLSAGNPLLLSMVAEAIVEGTGDTDRLPSTVLLVTKQRIAQLSARAVEVLEFAAVLPDPFPLDALKAMCEARTSHGELAGVLDEVETTGLVTVEAGVGRFNHALIAQAVRRLLTPARLADLSLCALGVLADQGVAAAALGTLARDASALDPALAISVLGNAGEQFLESFSDQEALSCYRDAADILERSGADAPRVECQVQLGLGRTLLRLGDPTHLDHLLAAGRLVEQLDDPELRATVAIELSQHSGTTQLGAPPEWLVQLLLDALDGDISIEKRLRLSASAPVMLSLSEWSAQGMRIYRAALDRLSLASGDDIKRDVLINLHTGLQSPFDFDERERWLDELRLLAGSDHDVEWEVAFLDYMQGTILGERDRVERALASVSDIADEHLRRPRQLGRLCCRLGAALLFDESGDLATVDSYITQILELGGLRHSQSVTTASAALASLVLSEHRGDLADLLPLWESVGDPGRRPPAWQGPHAMLLAVGGRVADARELLNAELASGFAFPPDIGWTIAMLFYGRAAVIVKASECARVIYSRLRQLSGTIGWGVTLPIEPVDLVLGELAVVLDDGDGARRHAAIAERVAAGIGSPRFHNRCQALRRAIDQ